MKCANQDIRKIAKKKKCENTYAAYVMYKWHNPRQKKTPFLCLQTTVATLTTEIISAHVVLSSCSPDGRGVHFHLSLGDKKLRTN